MAICCCVGLEESCTQGTVMNFLFRRDGFWQGQSVSTTSIGSKSNKLPQASLHFLRKIKSIQGVMEAYASDKKTTFVKLENQRIVCLKGYNADPLYECLREMYRAQKNEQFLNYLQGSRSSGASSSDRLRTTYTIPDYDFGVSCSDNVREYVLKKKFPTKTNPRSTSSKTSLMSGSQSSLDGTNVKTPEGGGVSGKSKVNKNGLNGKNGQTAFSQKVPMLQKALRELKGTQYDNKNYRNAALRHIDEYMRNSFNLDFVNLFTDTAGMRSYDDDEDIYTLGASHQKLKQYENLPYKQTFPPLTAYSDDESGAEETTQAPKLPGKKKRKTSTKPAEAREATSGHGTQRRNSDETDKIRGTSRKLLQNSPPSEQPLQRRHTISNPQKKAVKPRYIKVYRPGHSRPIFISGATTLGGLPEPSPARAPEKRLSDRLKHKPIPPRSIARLRPTEAAPPAANSCPLICDVGERDVRLAAGYGQTSSLSETYLYGRRYNFGDSEEMQTSFQKELRRAVGSKTVADAPGSQYDTSLPMEKSLQEANDLVRTLFDNLSIGAPAPVITVASPTSPTSHGITTVSPSSTHPECTVNSSTIRTSSFATSSTLTGQYSQPPQQQDSSESDSLPSISSNSDERKTV